MKNKIIRIGGGIAILMGMIILVWSPAGAAPSSQTQSTTFTISTTNCIKCIKTQIDCTTNSATGTWGEWGINTNSFGTNSPLLPSPPSTNHPSFTPSLPGFNSPNSGNPSEVDPTNPNNTKVYEVRVYQGYILAWYWWSKNQPCWGYPGGVTEGTWPQSSETLIIQTNIVAPITWEKILGTKSCINKPNNLIEYGCKDGAVQVTVGNSINCGLYGVAGFYSIVGDGFKGCPCAQWPFEKTKQWQFYSYYISKIEVREVGTESWTLLGSNPPPDIPTGLTAAPPPEPQ